MPADEVRGYSTVINATLIIICGGKMKEIIKYLIMTFTLTYLLWGSIALYTQINDKPFNTSLVMMVLYVLGVISPAISGIIVKKQSLAKEKFRVFLKNIILP